MASQNPNLTVKVKAQLTVKKDGEVVSERNFGATFELDENELAKAIEKNQDALVALGTALMNKFIELDQKRKEDERAKQAADHLIKQVFGR